MRRKKRAWKICFLFLGALFSFWLLLGFFPPKDLLSETDFSKVIFDRNGNLLRIFLTADEKYRLKTSVTDLPPKVLEAILAYEDKYFWTHPGVNPFSLLRGFSSLFVGRKMGGSTLTMQTVRLAYHVRTKTIWGKLKQIFYALWVERHFSKAEILTAYFSLAPYGGNVEGLQAASLFYFHKNAQSLQQGEIEALMLVPQNPGARHPRSENNRLFEACKRQWADGGEYARLRFFASSDLPFEPHQFDWTVLHLRDCDAPLLSDTLKEAIRVSRQGLAITFWNSSAPAFFLSLKRKGHEGFSWWKVFSALREEHEGSISTLTTLLFSFAPLRRLWPRLYFSTFSTRFPLGAWAVLRLDLSPRSTHTPLFLRTGLRRIQRLEPLDGTSCYSPQEISSHLSTLRNTLYVKEDKPKK